MLPTIPEPTRSDAATAMIRVVVKALVPFVLGRLALIPLIAKLGIDIDPGYVEAALYFVSVGAYSYGVSWLETQVHAKFGLLAGIPKAPVYAPPAEPPTPEV